MGSALAIHPALLADRGGGAVGSRRRPDSGPPGRSAGRAGKLVLQLLSALAPAIVLVAVVRALIDADLGGRRGVRLVGLLLLNTLVAISIGLLVVNVLRPGRHSTLAEPSAPSELCRRTRLPNC